MEFIQDDIHRSYQQPSGTGFEPYAIIQILYITVVLVLWFNTVKKNHYNTGKRIREEEDSSLDLIGYLCWFLCCFGLCLYVWTSDKHHTNDNKVVEGYANIYTVYLFGQSLLSLGHLKRRWTILEYLGQIIAAVGYHLVYLTYGHFIPPYTTVSFGALIISVLLTTLSILLKRYNLFGSGHAVATHQQTELLCDLFYVSGASLGLWTILRAYLDTGGNIVILRGLIGGVFGAMNLFWPKLLPKKYYKIVSRVSDCVTYVPWVLIAAGELDRITALGDPTTTSNVI